MITVLVLDNFDEDEYADSPTLYFCSEEHRKQHPEYNEKHEGYEYLNEREAVYCNICGKEING